MALPGQHSENSFLDNFELSASRKVTKPVYTSGFAGRIFPWSWIDNDAWALRRRAKSGATLRLQAISFGELTTGIFLLSQLRISVGHKSMHIDRVSPQLGNEAVLRPNCRFSLEHTLIRSERKHQPVSFPPMSGKELKPFDIPAGTCKPYRAATMRLACLVHGPTPVPRPARRLETVPVPCPPTPHKASLQCQSCLSGPDHPRARPRWK